MKKSIVASLFLFSLAFSSFACTLKSFVGHIDYYGNVPFAEPCLVTDKGEILRMAVSEKAKFTMEDIKALQGRRIKLTGKQDKDNKGVHQIKDGTLTIKKYKVLD
ncbi:MAG: hypothetical protein II921_03600 [Treponema sp.]|nr:hypothetical protein [Treponema sp.]